MKQKDIALFIAVALVSAVFSVIMSNLLFTPKNVKSQKAEVVERITTDFVKPDSKFFNHDSINPTKRIQIGDNSNTVPFNAPRP
jgi:hypothetical protein